MNDLKNEVKNLKDNQEKINNELLETISILKGIHHNFLIEITYIDLNIVELLLKEFSFVNNTSFLFEFNLNYIRTKKININCELLELTDMILCHESYNYILKNLYNLKYIKLLPYYYSDLMDARRKPINNKKSIEYDSTNFTTLKNTFNYITRSFNIDLVFIHKK